MAAFIVVARCVAALALLALCARCAAQPKLAGTDSPFGALDVVDVFTDGEQGYKAFRIPGLLAVNGTLLAFAEGRKYGCGDFDGQHNIVYKRSTDGGTTWGALQVLLDPLAMFGKSQCANVTSTKTSCEFWDPTPVADHTTGAVFMMTARSRSAADRLSGLEDMWLLRSDDLGVTWGKPKNITSDVWDPAFKLCTPANGHAIQSATGRLVMPCYVRIPHISSFGNAVIYSDDHGDSWHFAPSSTHGHGTSEGEIVALQHHAGRLMFNERRVAQPGGCSPTVKNCRWQSISDDDGLTWTSLAAVPELPDPGCKAGIVAWPAAKALLFSNVATTTARVNVTLRASFDDGQTWPNALLVSEAGGYSDIGRLAYQGQEYACVLLEANTCQIKLARVALKLPNQP
eukprot:m.98171 g.98171  ORF g.98171 m.98171 type:complete len:400 (+) comp15262_c1_seq2:14-1213(+)